MKRTSSWFFAVIILWNLSACNDVPAYQEPNTGSSSTTGEKIWTEEERTYLLEHLERTKEELMAATANLTDDQWHFKPDSSSWSIAQIVEHLAVIESYYYRDLVYGQYTPERRDLVDQVKANDEALIAYTNDPNTASAAFYAEPLGRFGSGKDLVTFFARYRDQVIDHVETTESDLRLHFAYRAPGSGIWTARDMHQYVLTLIAHAERHTNQMKRNKMATNYPGA